MQRKEDAGHKALDLTRILTRAALPGGSHREMGLVPPPLFPGKGADLRGINCTPGPWKQTPKPRADCLREPGAGPATPTHCAVRSQEQVCGSQDTLQAWGLPRGLHPSLLCSCLKASLPAPRALVNKVQPLQWLLVKTRVRWSKTADPSMLAAPPALLSPGPLTGPTWLPPRPPSPPCSSGVPASALQA